MGLHDELSLVKRVERVECHGTVCSLHRSNSLI